MSILFIIIGIIFIFSGFVCFQGIFARKLLQGHQAPLWNTQSISAELREWGTLFLLFITYPIGLIGGLPSKNENLLEEKPPVILIPGYGMHRWTLFFIQWYLHRRGYQGADEHEAGPQRRHHLALRVHRRWRSGLEKREFARGPRRRTTRAEHSWAEGRLQHS